MSILIKEVYATCPLCIVTVGGGLFLAEKLGVDNLLISIWISGLNTAIAFWLASLKKNKFIANPIIVSLIFYGLTLLYFWYSKQFGTSHKVFLGLTTGMLVFFLSVNIDKLLRHKNNNRVLVPYQKVFIPVILLGITTFVANLLLPILK